MHRSYSIVKTNLPVYYNLFFNLIINTKLPVPLAEPRQPVPLLIILLLRYLLPFYAVNWLRNLPPGYNYIISALFREFQYMSAKLTYIIPFSWCPWSVSCSSLGLSQCSICATRPLDEISLVAKPIGVISLKTAFLQLRRSPAKKLSRIQVW